MASLRLLAVAASSRRVGHVLLAGNRLLEWKMAVKPIAAPATAANWFQALITKLKPDVVVTEKLDETSRKGERSRSLTAVFEQVATDSHVLDVSIAPVRELTNKYQEADLLAKLYPDIKAWLPRKRLFYEVEPRRMAMFDALALAHSVIKRPSTTLASAMT